MDWDKRFAIFSEAILFSFGLIVFSFFIQYEFPYRIISYAALVLSAYIAARNLRSFRDLKKITGESGVNKIILLYCLCGAIIGVLLSMMYRYHLGISLFPDSMNRFVIVAALIGSTEELVFRGFLQDLVNNINGPFSIIFSSVSHTAYKCCLFISPAAATHINVGSLALWTLIAGILFGTIRHFSKSILPSVTAHALFDILVYAELAGAPWWVW